MDVDRIIQSFENRRINPNVIIFDDASKNIFNQVINKLQTAWTIVDITKIAIVTPNDYNIPLKNFGADAPDNVTILDAELSDKKKQKLIVRYKLESFFTNNIDDHTIVLVYYNDLFLENSTFYDDATNSNILFEMVRKWLKDGNLLYGSQVNGIVFAETSEKVQDFCPYGRHVHI